MKPKKKNPPYKNEAGEIFSILDPRPSYIKYIQLFKASPKPKPT